MSRHCVQCDRFLRFSGGSGASSALSSALTGEFVDASLEQWSATCRVPLPLCLHCLRATGNGISSEITKLRTVKAEWEAAASDLSAVASGSGSVDEDDEAMLEAEIAHLQAEVVSTRKHTAAVVIEPVRRWWRDHSVRMWRLDKSKEATDSCAMRCRRQQDILCKLQNLTVCNDVFFIWSEAQFGTVNGLKLGTLHGQAVDWIELNAALGYVALLITTIANWTGCQFTEYRIVPQGSFSKITKIGDERKMHELYLSNRMFAASRFHQSLKCLLSCLKDLIEFATNNDRSLQLPYRVTDSRVNDLSVDFDRPIVWTRAMKCLLTDVKWLLSWATRWRRGGVVVS